MGGTKTVPLCLKCHGKVHEVKRLSISELTKRGQERTRYAEFQIVLILMNRDQAELFCDYKGDRKWINKAAKEMSLRGEGLNACWIARKLNRLRDIVETDIDYFCKICAADEFEVGA
jgi:hypothetical protein